MHIFHIAEASRWEAAKVSGAYVQSTRGRTLDDEGFIHAARDDQWQDVRRRYWSGAAEPLVLLVINTEKLSSPWQEDVVGDTTYPHIYGPLNPSAVVTAVPLGPAGSAVTVQVSAPEAALDSGLVEPAEVEPAEVEAAEVEPDPVEGDAEADGVPGRSPDGPDRTFFQEFLAEMAFRMLVAVAVMVLAVVCALVGSAAADDVGALVGLLLGVTAGTAGAVPLSRRRDARLRHVH